MVEFPFHTIYMTLHLMRGMDGQEWSLPQGATSTGRTEKDGDTLWIEFPGGVWFSEASIRSVPESFADICTEVS